MGKKRQFGDPPVDSKPTAASSSSRRDDREFAQFQGGSFRGPHQVFTQDDDNIPRPKKVKQANLQKMTLDDLTKRKHDLKQEENYHNVIMSKKKRGAFSASDIRATYTQVLRTQYLQKEVDLEIERREAKKESKAEAKAQRQAEEEKARRAQEAALRAAREEALARGEYVPGVNHPGAPGPYSNQGGDFEDESGGAAQASTSTGMGGMDAGGSSSMAAMASMFGNSSGSSGASGGMAANPMLAMAQMMMETQKKLKAAQAKMAKMASGSSEGAGSSSSGGNAQLLSDQLVGSTAYVITTQISQPLG